MGWQRSSLMFLLMLIFGFAQNITCDLNCIDYINCQAKGNYCYNQGNYSMASILFEKAADYITLGSGQEREKAELYVRAADLTKNKSRAEKLYTKALEIFSEYGYGEYISLVQERLFSLHSSPNKTIITTPIFFSEEKAVPPYPLYTFLFIVLVGGAVILLKFSSKDKKSRKTEETPNP
jgi:tetratricopeptide (TPR) repeat protein